jgi:hypothetical protein
LWVKADQIRGQDRLCEDVNEARLEGGEGEETFQAEMARQHDRQALVCVGLG